MTSLHTPRRAARLLAAFTVLAVACGDKGGTNPPGPPASIEVTAGDAQSAIAGTVLPQLLSVTVRDSKGRSVPNVPVTFVVSAGGGTLTPSSAVTNALGVAGGVAWTLGTRGGAQSVTATAVTFTKTFTATIQSSYPLDLRFYGPPMSTEAQTAFLNAANRMRAAIISQTTTFSVEGRDLTSDCHASGLTGTLTGTTAGVIIYAAVAAIDGPGKIVAQAGPCDFIRGSNKLPFLGFMEFDSADIQNYITTGRFESVVLHEMNHVLGFGTIWDLKGLLANPAFTYDSTGTAVATGSTNPRFLGSAAIANCLAVGGTANHCAAGAGVAVEATGGDGTADGHWRESSFDSELMTGFVESAPNMPWSTISIGSFQDLGYSVNTLAADPYTVPNLLTMARLSRMQEAALQDGPQERLRRPKFEISSTGRATAIKEKR